MKLFPRLFKKLYCFTSMNRFFWIFVEIFVPRGIIDKFYFLNLVILDLSLLFSRVFTQDLGGPLGKNGLNFSSSLLGTMITNHILKHLVILFLKINMSYLQWSLGNNIQQTWFYLALDIVEGTMCYLSYNTLLPSLMCKEVWGIHVSYTPSVYF